MLVILLQYSIKSYKFEISKYYFNISKMYATHFE